jgi:hypothetical protein
MVWVMLIFLNMRPPQLLTLALFLVCVPEDSAEASLKVAPSINFPHFEGGIAQAVSVHNGKACVAIGYGGTALFDVTDPIQPRFLNSFHNGNDVTDISVLWPHAYVAGRSRFQILDISDSSSIRLVAELTNSTPTFSSTPILSIFGSLVLLGDGTLRIIDISDPQAPAEIATYKRDIPNFNWSVTGQFQLLGSRAYLGSSLISRTNQGVRSWALEIVDLNNPAAPQLVGSYSLPQSLRALKVKDSIAFVGLNDHTVQILNIVNAADIKLVSSFKAQSWPLDIEVTDSKAYVAEGTKGVGIYDSTDLSAIRSAGRVQAGVSAQSIDLSGADLYVADHSAGLRICDVANPASPHLLGDYDTYVDVSEVAVSGDYAFIADYSSGLEVYRINQSTAPTRMFRNSPARGAVGIKLDGNRAYLADTDLRVFDISIPSNCQLLGSFPLQSLPSDMCVQDSHIYIARADGFEILEARDPSQIRPVTFLPSSGALRVTVAGTRAYTSTLNGISVYDINNPAAPVLIGEHALRFPMAMAVVNNIGYVANAHNGLVVLDLSNPADVKELARHPVNGSAEAIQVWNSYAFVGAWLNGVQVFDITVPAEPRMVASHSTPGLAQSLFVTSSAVYVGTRWGGLSLIRGMPGLFFTLEITADPGVPAISIEAAGDLAAVQWGPVLITNSPPHQFQFTDWTQEARNFYRLRQH